MNMLGWLAVTSATLLLFWVSVPAFVLLYDQPIAVAFGLATLQCAGLPLAIRFPWAAILLQLASIVTVGVVTSSTLGQQWPMTWPELFSVTGLLVILGLRERWITPVIAWWLNFLTLVIVIALWVGSRDQGDWGINLLGSVTVTLIGLIASVGLGQRRRIREVLVQARRDVELEQAKRLAVEERARIARELHDVVAHSMSMVHIQAESARFRIDTMDQAKEEFAEIAGAARSALGEMRQLLGALRPDGDDVQYLPQPTLEDIPTLIRNLRSVGHSVTYSNDLPPDRVTTINHLTIFRIVQEALSNVMRHAPRSSVAVAIAQTTEGLSIRIENDAPLDNRSRDLRPQDSGGHGLRGMRERVELLGGTVEQRPTPLGGFLVSATLPDVELPREGKP
jgi:signal transduction histidine kinase